MSPILIHSQHLISTVLPSNVVKWLSKNSQIVSFGFALPNYGIMSKMAIITPSQLRGHSDPASRA